MSNQMEGNIKIGTHDDGITCNEVLACMLLKLLPRYMNAVIVRTQDQDILDSCDIVVGIGGIYDPSIHRYDYHMREFYETANTILKKPNYNRKIKLSSAGLIYCHFGHEILKILLPHIKEDRIIDELFKEIYDTIIVQIDAQGNNQIMPAYHSPYYEPAVSMCDDLCNLVRNINYNTWKKGAYMEEDELFEKAMAMILHTFMDFVICAEKVWLPARKIVQNAINSRFEIHPSGQIIELSESVPWQQHLYSLEREIKLDLRIMFVIFSSGNGYLIHCVPVTSKTSFFSRRIDFPGRWRGLSNEALVAVCGIEDAEFVHRNGLIARHKTRDGAITMAMTAFQIEISSAPYIHEKEPSYNELENMAGDIWNSSEYVPI
ncbi:PREDICTED: UPF0160 protein MYG1, mitochondrial-like [Dinoponera quadriceps]|uniref:UPF0160 protein MYG1, mitochondrial-like n=1 Tax=Dinoponera quadriceps TaxID=609295 RepID=A0A6P3XE55_DINQU|nr:PREDICTED: UPF0160 protein MYG1, mitochondrial-like [Dinoponera quadriceps]